MHRRTGVIFDPAVQTCIFDHSWAVNAGGGADRRRLSDSQTEVAQRFEAQKHNQANAPTVSDDVCFVEVARLKAEVAALEEENSQLRSGAEQKRAFEDARPSNMRDYTASVPEDLQQLKAAHSKEIASLKDEMAAKMDAMMATMLDAIQHEKHNSKVQVSGRE